MAIEDFNQHIKLKPDDEGPYFGRGNAYVLTVQYQRAIEDFNEAIRLKPDYAGAYLNRGITYSIQGDEGNSCSDIQRACELGACDGLRLLKGTCASYYFKKGWVSGTHGNNLQAIGYYTEAIRIKPDHAKAYAGRGTSYLLWDKKNLQGCLDLIKACQLGECGGLEIARRYEKCR